MSNFKVPVAVLTFLAAQLGGAIWWASQVDSRVKTLEAKSLNLATENRIYLDQVVIPSYEIGDNWDNPHHNNWIKSGGWKSGTN